MQELERISGSTRQALSMANDAAIRGDTVKAGEYNQTAEAFANRLIVTEKRVDDLKNMHLQATQAAQQAKAAVQQNANALQQKLADRQKLLSQLDQARMQEQLNTAMVSLSQTVGQDVPTFDDVRAKIESQYAKALGTAELSGQNVEARMLEIEQASVNMEAQQRLDVMRNQMGLPAGVSGGAAELSAPSRAALSAQGQPAALNAAPAAPAAAGDGLKAQMDVQKLEAELAKPASPADE
jgi:phage shock protein A